MLPGFHETALFFAATGAFLAAIEIGYRLGKRKSGENDEDGMRHITGLQSALLGLLALLLGFNFAMASSRFDTRKALIQEEVNAIGTTWTRAQLLPAPEREVIPALLREYVEARMEYTRAGVDEARVEAANVHASRVEEKLRAETAVLETQAPNAGAVGLFVQSFNDVVNVRWKRRAAEDNHVPGLVLNLLFTVAISALGIIAYGYGLTGKRRHISTGIFAVMIAMVLATILDFDQPRRGFIQVGEEGMLRLQSALKPKGS